MRFEETDTSFWKCLSPRLNRFQALLKGKGPSIKQENPECEYTSLIAVAGENTGYP